MGEWKHMSVFPWGAEKPYLFSWMGPDGYEARKKVFGVIKTIMIYGKAYVIDEKLLVKKPNYFLDPGDPEPIGISETADIINSVKFNDLRPANLPITPDEMLEALSNVLEKMPKSTGNLNAERHTGIVHEIGTIGVHVPEFWDVLGLDDINA